MRVEFGLKIPSRLGKNVRKSQGGFFDSHCIVYILCNNSWNLLLLQASVVATQPVTICS